MANRAPCRCDHPVAAIVANNCYTLRSIFSGLGLPPSNCDCDCISCGINCGTCGNGRQAPGICGALPESDPFFTFTPDPALAPMILTGFQRRAVCPVAMNHRPTGSSCIITPTLGGLPDAPLYLYTPAVTSGSALDGAQAYGMYRFYNPTGMSEAAPLLYTDPSSFHIKGTNIWGPDPEVTSTTRIPTHPGGAASPFATFSGVIEATIYVPSLGRVGRSHFLYLGMETFIALGETSHYAHLVESCEIGRGTWGAACALFE